MQRQSKRVKAEAQCARKFRDNLDNALNSGTTLAISGRLATMPTVEENWKANLLSFIREEQSLPSDEYDISLKTLQL